MESRKPQSHVRIGRYCVRLFSHFLAVLVVLFGSAESAAALPNLLVTSQLDHTVKEYNGTTGAFIRNAATGVGDPLDAIIGADGNLLVTDGQQDAIKRFDRATGSFLGIFASAVSPLGMTISGGKVYVCQSNPPQIVRSFDAVTGADVGSFVPTVGGGNPSPRDAKVANGRLYVAYWNLGTIEMFDLSTRQSLGLLFPPGTGGLSTPFSIAFGPDGSLYVSYAFFVNRYHPTTGAFLGQFVDTGDRTGLRYAVGIAWGPDGNLYVSTQNTPGVQRYDGLTGAFMDDFVPAASGGLTAPFHISFTSANRSPDCGGAVASEPVMWPPNHKYRGIAIDGVTDPDGDPVTIVVTGITQDEPVNGRGDGNACPDGQIVSGQASVRAERTGTPGAPGNGRVYAISFTADDGKGGQCTGTVHVCVPHDQGNPTCIDDGQNYDSLGPCTGAATLAPEAVSLSVGEVTGAQARLTFALPSDAHVDVSAFDVTGRRLATIEDAQLSKGLYERSWNMVGVSNGLYYVRLRVDGVTLTKTVLKVR